MKMTIKANDYKTIIKPEGEITCERVYNGIGIKTDQGLFGIAQRDDGIEICLDGKLVWSSTNYLFGKDGVKGEAD